VFKLRRSAIGSFIQGVVGMPSPFRRLPTPAVLETLRRLAGRAAAKIAFDVDRRRLTGAGAIALSGLAAPVSATPAESGANATLERAVQAFFASWSSGDWRPFLDLCADQMVFQFPVGPQKGRHSGMAGKTALIAWTRRHQETDSRILESRVDLKLLADDWIIVCDRGSGRIEGAPYTGLHAIFMHLSPDGRIDEFREYFGEV
jgi:ketosteroid isomerase-like protein